MPLSTQSLREGDRQGHVGPWAVSAYKEGYSDEFEDGSTHIFGLYDDEETAEGEAERLRASGEWQADARPVVVAPAT